MEKSLVNKLKKDPHIADKIVAVCEQYISAGETVLNQFATGFNTAHDTYNCYRALTKDDIELYDRGAPKFYTLPMTATHVSTMASFITGTLFGNDSPLKVSARGPEDEQAADLVNQLLKWNQEQHKAGFYQLGYFWVESALLYNRGIMYESWKTRNELTFETVQEEVEPARTELEENPETGEEVMVEYPAVFEEVTRKVRKPAGGYNHLEIISPYDGLFDPAFPLYRFQEGRFAGHRTFISWADLRARSKKEVISSEYVFPEAVDKLRGVKNGMDATSNVSNKTNNENLLSRTEWERTGNASAMQQFLSTDKHDGGLVVIHELWVRLVPKDFELGSGTEPELFRIMLGNKKELLAIEESTYLHDEFPYAIGEARPSAFYAFAPSWAIMLKPLQDMVDYLKDRHQDALARTVGNVFVVRSQFVDVEDFTNPKKEGLILSVTDNTPPSMPLEEIVKQIPISDMTASFNSEMGALMSFAEQITAASTGQGGGEQEGSATQFVSQMEMASGRLMTVARLLSQQGLLPQTRRFVKNFQQFIDDETVIRIRGNQLEVRPSFLATAQTPFITINRDTIQGEFDFSVDDITLPGTQTRQVAAATRVLEAATAYPQIIDPTDPTAIDLKAVFLWTLKSSGLNIENFIVGPDQAQANMQKIQAGQTMESKDINALSALIKAIKPEATSAIQPILSYILDKTGISAAQQQKLMEQMQQQQVAQMQQMAQMAGATGAPPTLPTPNEPVGEPLEPSGGERMPIPEAMGTNDPGMPNVETIPSAAPPQVRPTNV
jgi:hypothetical protein